MGDNIIDEADADAPHEQGESGEHPTTEFTGKSLVRSTAVFAATALTIAVLVNWVFGPAEPMLLEAAVPASELRRPAELELDKPAIALLPKDIVSYETIAVHAVPGQGNRAAEAIYATLNMNLDVMVPISIYARVDGYETSDSARRKADELLTRFPKKRSSLVLGNGQAVAETGYTENEGAWVAVWTIDSYTVYVKSAFKDKIPVEKRKFLENLAKPVIEAVYKFQRTGKQGIQL